MSRLTDVAWGSNKLHFTYDSIGPASVTYNGNRYFDVTGLVNASGTMAATLGAVNPLRYRGYVYDSETGLYYLSSRYYNPVWGRFINADGLIVDCGANTQNLLIRLNLSYRVLKKRFVLLYHLHTYNRSGGHVYYIFP